LSFLLLDSHSAPLTFFHFVSLCVVISCSRSFCIFDVALFGFCAVINLLLLF
jgi:hypothetical protein